MTEEEIKTYLRNVRQRATGEDTLQGDVENALSSLKQVAVQSSAQDTAKYYWCLQQILRAQNLYISALKKIKAGEYYDAWCELEQAALSLRFLKPHWNEGLKRYNIGFIDEKIEQLQKLYPYKIFMSPEILELEKKCSICAKLIMLRNPCGHKVGEIYDGEMCSRLITKWRALATAFVEDPVQKYSVPFPVDVETGKRVDNYDYSLLRYLGERLSNPFDEWSVKWSKERHPHSHYDNIGRNDKCPCESGKKYKKCCLPESGVLRPHCDFIFEVPPDPSLMNIEYTR